MQTSIGKLTSCISLLVIILPSIALAQAKQRPIEEFVEAQGTYCAATPTGCLVADPPIGSILGWMRWTDGFRRFAKVDYAGLVDRYLAAHGLPTWGTTFEGSITERPLTDGTAELAEVSVRLHTRNAPAWVRYNPWIDDGDGQGSSSEVTGPSYWVWGAPPAGLAAGAEAALVDVEYRIVFISPSMGAPMPDLLQFSFDPAYIGKRLFTSVSAHGLGTFNAAAAEIGIGEPGDPANLVLRQTGLLARWAAMDEKFEVPPVYNGVFNNGGYPAEVLELHAVGFGK